METKYLNIETLSAREATVSCVEHSIKGIKKPFQASGVAKLDPQDRYDPLVGELLADGRALEALGRKLIKRAQGLTKHQDDMRVDKQKKNKKKAKHQKKAQKARDAAIVRAAEAMEKELARTDRQRARAGMAD